MGNYDATTNPTGTPHRDAWRSGQRRAKSRKLGALPHGPWLGGSAKDFDISLDLYSDFDANADG